MGIKTHRRERMCRPIGEEEVWILEEGRRCGLYRRGGDVGPMQEEKVQTL